MGFQFDSADPEPKYYEGLPSLWAGIPYDFVQGGAGLEILGHRHLPRWPAGRGFPCASSSGRPHAARDEGPHVHEAVGPMSREGGRGSGRYPGPSVLSDSSRATSSRPGQASGRPSASHTPEPGSAVPIWAAAWPC